jgi:magnesium transporter
MTLPVREENLSDPVSRHMRREFTRVLSTQTVSEALQSLRERPPEGRIIYFYVVDGEDRLLGVIPTRQLLLSSSSALIADVMVRRVVALPATATVLDACEFFIQHRFLAFPVVDENRRLVGVVDVELYTDELSQLGEAPARDDLFQLIGVHVANARPTRPTQAFRNRFPWLLCNVAGGILAAFLSGLYQEELQRVVALALFVPVVLALAESVSVQSVSLALESLRGRTPTWRSMLYRLGSELVTGLLLGAASGGVVALVALAWLGHPRVALCLLVGIAGGVAAAAGFGLALPFLLRLLRREPQVAAGPIALAAADVLTLLLYFNLARWLLT